MSLDASRRAGISSWCKECRQVSSRKWVANNPEKVKQQKETVRLKYREKPPEYLKTRDWILNYRYGLNNVSYQELLETQNYCCAICQRDSREMTYLLHVDHDHTSGKVRGLLCSPCNVYLGYIKDNKQIYTNGINYIEENNHQN